MASKKRSDHEGSIYQRHIDSCPPAVDRKRPEHKCAGPWVGVYVTGWRDGKPIRRKVTARSKTSAASKLRELREKVESGQLPKGRIPTVEEWMTHWLETIAAKRVKPSTLRGYRTYVTCYIIPLLGQHRLDRLTPEHIASAWTYMQEVGRPGAPTPRPLSSTSAHQAHRVLARALKVAHNRGHATKNVATLLDDVPQPANTPMQVLTKKQADAILETAIGQRNAARWRVALAIGLRQGEALGLRWGDLDDDGVLHVRRSLGRVKGQGLVCGTVKSHAGQRDIKLPRRLVDELRAHRVAQNAERLRAGSWWTDEDYIFTREDGRPIDPKLDWTAWKALCATAGVGDVRLHSARHTAATMLLAMGVPQRVVMEILGHSRITVTSKYQHVLEEMHLDAAEKMDAFWG